jgi:hypothetical protein
LPLLVVAMNPERAVAASAEAQQFCKRYAGHAASESIVAQNLKCGFTGEKWSTDSAVHMQSCLFAFDLNVGAHGEEQGEAVARQIVNQQDAARVADLKTCQTVRATDSQNGDTGGGDGQTATAPNGTTIYKEPNGDESKANIAGYVGRGKSVTIVDCDGSWCKVSAPKAGWVWGADLNR